MLPKFHNTRFHSLKFFVSYCTAPTLQDTGKMCVGAAKSGWDLAGFFGILSHAAALYLLSLWTVEVIRILNSLGEMKISSSCLKKYPYIWCCWLASGLCNSQSQWLVRCWNVSAKEGHFDLFALKISSFSLPTHIYVSLLYAGHLVGGCLGL